MRRVYVSAKNEQDTEAKRLPRMRQGRGSSAADHRAGRAEPWLCILHQDRLPSEKFLDDSYILLVAAK
jgi:hypothetical protein